MVATRTEKNRDSAKIKRILDIVQSNFDKHIIWSVFAEAILVEIHETDKLSKLSRYVRTLPISSFSMLTYMRHASRNNYIHRNIIVAETLNYVEKTKNIKDIVKALPFPKNIITSYYLLTNYVHCESYCNKIGVDMPSLFINAEYNIDAYKSFSDIMKTMDSDEARHLVDLHLLKGHVDTLSDADFHNEIKKWVSSKKQIFSGKYQDLFMIKSRKYIIQSLDTNFDDLKLMWYKNLMSDGAVKVEGMPHISKTFFFSTKTIEQEWDNFMHILNETEEPMISYPSQKNEIGKTRAIANTNILSHYIMTLIYTVFLLNCQQAKDPELYALLSTDAQTKLFNDLSQKISEGYVSNSIDQTHFDWNVRMYQILSVSENILKTSSCVSNIISRILDRISHGIVKTKIGTIKHEDGLLSGWKTTSLFGSIINKLQATVIETVAQEIEPLFQIAVLKAYMGDDVIHMYMYRRDAMLINRLYKESKLEVSYSKTIISNAKAEFLRTQIYPNNVKYGYPGRAVTSLFIAKPWSNNRTFSLAAWCTNSAVYYRRTQSRVSKMIVISVIRNITKCTYSQAVDLATTPSLMGGLNMWSKNNNTFAKMKILTYNKPAKDNIEADKVLPPINGDYFKALSPNADQKSYIFPKLGTVYREMWKEVKHEYSYIVTSFEHVTPKIDKIKEPCSIKTDNEHMHYAKSFLNSFTEPLSGIWSMLKRESNYKTALLELDRLKIVVFNQVSRLRKYHNMSSRLLDCLISGKVGSPNSYEFNASDQSSIFSKLVSTALMRRPFLSAGIDTLLDIFVASMETMHANRSMLGYDYW